MMWLLRLLLLIFVFFILYRIVAFLLKPEWRLAFARLRKKFYLMDNAKNVRMNFLLTHKGFLIEGEKYADKSDRVTSISLWPTDPFNTKLSEEDIQFIEKSLLNTYSHAKIEWKYPK
ncbi:sigma-w pathway protein ysdB [Niallia nealsonii]|uniref:Sigma-w pathway protein ysdB n=1 Tax=Niallia nealsonii TaxID=115979 RepID=A0A2N0Z688_9BACI|nr:sigma-w pathway protein ysdB [Niallia nealsonii]PKG25019.1 sigma-w pathway protein ysdB [Niallia nealsonii]